MLILGEATHYAQLMDLQEWSCQHLIDKQIQGKYALEILSVICSLMFSLERKRKEKVNPSYYFFLFINYM